MGPPLRPVSILNSVSKNLEGLVYNQVESHFKDKHFLYEFQSGFRNGFSLSTDTCLIHLTYFIGRTIDQGTLVDHTFNEA